MSTDFPFDDPIWDDAPCAYGQEPIRKMLADLTDAWNAEDADYLLFSALLHQETVYPATFLALPHVLALAETAPDEAIPTLAQFAGGVALNARLPSTSGGVSLVENEGWAATSLGQKAAAAFATALPRIAELNTRAYKMEPSHYYASGVAAALGHIELACWLYWGENGGFLCPSCEQDNQWLMFGDIIAVYAGQFSLEDWKAGKPGAAASTAVLSQLTPETADVKSRLGPLDATTATLLSTHRAEMTCSSCGWSGIAPDPRISG